MIYLKEGSLPKDKFGLFKGALEAFGAKLGGRHEDAGENVQLIAPPGEDVVPVSVPEHKVADVERVCRYFAVSFTKAAPPKIGPAEMQWP